MNQFVKVTLGVVTVAPLVVLVVSLIRLIQEFSTIAAAGGSVSSQSLSEALAEITAFQLGAAIATVVLLCFYLWHLLVHRAATPPAGRALWSFLLLVFNVFSMPVYWYLFVFGAEPVSAPESR